MRIDLHKSPIGLLRDHIDAWSKRTGASNQIEPLRLKYWPDDKEQA